MSQWDLVSAEFAKASVTADQAPAGPDRVRAHEAALRLAESSGSFAEGFTARLDLTQALMDASCTAEHLDHVAWLRRALDTGPRLDRADRDAVLSRLRWGVRVMEDTPEVPLDTLVAAIDDLAEVLRAEGGQLRPVHAARARLAHARGDDVTARREVEEWVRAPHDPGGDCPVCELVQQAAMVRGSDPDRAISLVAPVVRGEVSCGDGPGAALALDADLRLERDDVDAAVTSFRRAWQLCEDDPAAADTVGSCLRVLLRLGNADRAVDLVAPRLGWLESLRTDRERMWFAATAAFVLERADAVGLAPAVVGGRPVAELAAELGRRGREVARAFDARYRSTVTSRELAAAHDPSLLPESPALPPTRLPTRRATTEPRPEEVPPSAGVLDRAAGVRVGLASVSEDLDAHVRAWLRDRESLVPVTTSEEWAAVSLLDRVAAQDAGEPARRRSLLDSALAAARRAGDDEGATRCQGELALLDVEQLRRGEPMVRARGRARACAERLEAAGADAEAGGLWRRIAWFGRSPDAAAHLRRAGEAYARARLHDRSLLCAIERVVVVGTADPEVAATQLDDLEREVGDRPVLQVMLLDARSRLARATGDLAAAATYLRAGVARRGLPDRVRHEQLLLLGDVLVEQEAWEALEVPGADVVAAACRTGDPLLLAHGQRLLGLSYAGTDRPVEAAELLSAAQPVLREHAAGLVGAVGWALGDALVALARWPDARAAFAAAATDFDREGRREEAAHCLWQAGNAAWDAGDTTGAARHFDVAVEGARACAAVGLFVEVLRSRAALRAEGGDLEGGLAELDAAIPAGERLAAQAGVGDEEFDGEVVEPHVLRQGAHLLAEHGRVDAAVERLARAEALVGADLELALRAEAGAVLADHDRLAEAEPRLRASLVQLSAADMVEERVEAAGALARALERAGRGAEAEDVWERFGARA